jgi:hypothetical protein
LLPPFACATPSRVTCRLMVSFMVSSFLSSLLRAVGSVVPL